MIGAMSNQNKYTSYSPYIDYSYKPPDQPVKKRGRHAKRIGIVLDGVLVIVLALFVFKSFDRVHGIKLPDSTSNAASAQTVATTSSTVNADAMSAEINQTIAAHPEAQISVSITDLSTSSKSYDYGVNAGYLAASTAKLITATLFLHDVEQGKYTMQTTVNGNTAAYELTQMIEVSDNDAWTGFNALMGDSNLQAWADQLGMTSYDVNTNVLTSHDLASLLTKLYAGNLLNDSDKQLLLGHMAKANRTEFIVASVPPGVKVYHKAGWLSDRIHDAAIIDDGSHAYVLVVYTKTDGDYDEATEQAIFKAITDTSIKYILENRVTAAS